MDAVPRFPGPRTLWVAGALLAVLATASLEAQGIRGTVVDNETGEPVAVAMVLLLDEAGEQVARVVTDRNGAFHVRPVAAGRYGVRVQRIGYRDYRSDVIDVGPGETAVVRLAIATAAIRLAAVVVEGERRCRLSREEGLLISDLWEEARKNLELAVWTEDAPGIHVRVREHDRTRDLVTLAVTGERYRAWAGMTRNPFFARAPAELAEEGFVRETPDGYQYFGLSAETILSPEFQDTHCFRVRPPGRGQPRNQIGLAFEPVPGHPMPDVTGVLWLDRETAVLDRVEYAYTRHLAPVIMPLERFGGRTDFRRLENGAIVIEGWWIRTPQFERIISTDDLPAGAVARRLDRHVVDETRRQFRRLGVSIREVGAEVVSIALAGEWAPSGTAAIEGQVYDGLAAADPRDRPPLAGATVHLMGTRYETVTDEGGRFRLEALPEGEWVVAFQHPMLDELGVLPEAKPVALAAGASVRVELATPTLEAVLGSRCAPGEDWVAGFVRSRADGAPLADVLVVAEWDEGWRRVGERVFQAERRDQRGAVTDETGAYVVCGVSATSRLRLRAEPPGGRAVRAEAAVVAGEGGRADFTLDVAAEARPVPVAAAPAPMEEIADVAAPARPGRILGRVVDEATGQPLAGAIVRLGPDGPARVTTSIGGFLFPTAPVGTATITARFIGYATVEGEVEVRTGETVPVEVRLSTEVIPLDPIVVVADMRRIGRLADFRYRSARGIGTFITREDIERRRPFHVTDMLADLGWLEQGDGRRVFVVNRRTQCGPAVYLDGHRLTTGGTVDADVAVNLVHPGDVEGIEIYAGPGTTPGQFGGSTARCGVIAIWTR